MAESSKITCPNCHSSSMVLRLEASFVYSYVLDSDAPGRKNTDEFLSFLYDRRDQNETKQYVECTSCGSRFPCYFNSWDKNTSLNSLQEMLDQSVSYQEMPDQSALHQ